MFGRKSLNLNFKINQRCLEDIQNDTPTQTLVPSKDSSLWVGVGLLVVRMGLKKSFKQVLLEAFFRKDFLESENKTEQVSNELKHSFKWFLGYSIFIGFCVILVYASI